MPDLHEQNPPEEAVLVRCSGDRWYAARWAEIEQLLRQAGTREENLEALLPPDRTPLLYPDLPLASALPFLGRWPVLPISNRARKRALEGIVSLQELLRGFEEPI